MRLLLNPINPVLILAKRTAPSRDTPWRTLDCELAVANRTYSREGLLVPSSHYTTLVLICMARVPKTKMKGYKLVPSNVSRPHRYCMIFPIVALLLLFLLVADKREKDPSQVTMKLDGSINEGEVGGIPYYHCSTKTATTSLVLLHGAKFTKEEWKKSGILTQFCAHSSLQVTALDLSVRASTSDLQKVLAELAANGLAKLPVAGLVTPSASGKAMVDWVSTGGVNLSSYVAAWIPVAALSVLEATTADLSVLKDIQVLAVYGDQDVGGKKSSFMLESGGGATVVELKGRHPVYLDSPDDFVVAVLDFVKIGP